MLTVGQRRPPPAALEIYLSASGRRRSLKTGSAHRGAGAAARTAQRKRPGVLRDLPTNLSKREIANICPATVMTHSDHSYTKLGVHTRGKAVEWACALVLLDPTARR